MRVWSKISLVVMALVFAPLVVGCGSSTISEEDAAAQEKASGASDGDNADDGGGKKRPEKRDGE